MNFRCFIDRHLVERDQSSQYLDTSRRYHDSHFLRAAATTGLRRSSLWSLDRLSNHVRSKEMGQELGLEYHANKKV